VITIIRWKKELELGIEKIDAQHKEFFVMAHSLLNEMKFDDNQVKKYNAKKFLDFIKKYFKYHFIEEEKLQISIDYPEYRDHKQEHEDFIVKIEGIISELDHETADYKVYLKLHNTVLGWFSDHISYVDYKIKEFIDTQ